MVGFCIFFAMDMDLSGPRSPASIPSNYDSMKACEKQEVLWEQIRSTSYTKELPDYPKFGALQLLGMSLQELSTKGKRHSDFAPDKWKKYLHRRGSIAKVKLVPHSDKYTGIFNGFDCGLLRLSLTYRPKSPRAFAPGLALKVLRNGTHSANISALVSLNGQEFDFNFFKYPMSNIVPMSSNFGQKMVHKVFKRISDFPEELVVNHMSEVDAEGNKIETVVSPRQLFFVPGDGLNFSFEDHDVRKDFHGISTGTVVYKVYAAPEKYRNYDYADYKEEMKESFVQESEHIADIVTTSEFMSSDFGDDGIFFRHQFRY